MVAHARRDRRAFAPLYDRYAGPVYGFCCRRLSSRDEAADATSQTFIKALDALPRYRTGSFRAWLFAIAANVVTDMYRRQQPTATLESEERWLTSIVDRSPTPEDRVIAIEEEQSVAKLLDQLTSEQRRIVELRLAGLKGVEIAEVLGLSVTAVRSSQFRAYARLRRLMAHQRDKEARNDG